MYINESGNVVNSGGYEILLDGNTVSGADTIVNNGNYNTGLITFTIDEVEYQAYNGMTWEEFVNSKYNTLGLTIRGNDVHGEGGFVDFDGIEVDSSDTIIENRIYRLVG